MLSFLDGVKFVDGRKSEEAEGLVGLALGGDGGKDKEIGIVVYLESVVFRTIFHILIAILREFFEDEPKEHLGGRKEVYTFLEPPFK
ncbi:MAG: hypothetical protein J6Y20_04575 [Lachnospiraceae bacterium]|nr:hypothetical protein [Lachnospiraceae bacterium]